MMVSDGVPQVSERPSAPVDPCAAARCGSRAERGVPLRLGGQERLVPLCEQHAERWTSTGP